ncbi:unnamed protein product [Protopolystoma xenopodis]|uniref:Uncharacterized protein n=1 Tax=Protopolystoma xenopodis TaxID=117903 RepID=A0A448XDC2_9PLAT|nr:unnamed protein product [Protopolystoma xenopodis]
MQQRTYQYLAAFRDDQASSATSQSADERQNVSAGFLRRLGRGGETVSPNPDSGATLFSRRRASSAALTLLGHLQRSLEGVPDPLYGSLSPPVPNTGTTRRLSLDTGHAVSLSQLTALQQQQQQQQHQLYHHHSHQHLHLHQRTVGQPGGSPSSPISPHHKAIYPSTLTDLNARQFETAYRTTLDQLPDFGSGLLSSEPPEAGMFNFDEIRPFGLYSASTSSLPADEQRQNNIDKSGELAVASLAAAVATSTECLTQQTALSFCLAEKSPDNKPRSTDERLSGDVARLDGQLTASTNAGHGSLDKEASFSSTGWCTTSAMQSSDPQISPIRRNDMKIRRGSLQMFKVGREAVNERERSLNELPWRKETSSREEERDDTKAEDHDTNRWTTTDDRQDEDSHLEQGHTLQRCRNFENITRLRMSTGQDIPFTMDPNNSEESQEVDLSWRDCQDWYMTEVSSSAFCSVYSLLDEYEVFIPNIS